VLHNDVLGFNRDIGYYQVSVASISVGSAIFDKGLVVVMVSYNIGIS